MGGHCNSLLLQYDQCLQKWGPPQCKYYGSVKHNDPAASIIHPGKELLMTVTADTHDCI